MALRIVPLASGSRGNATLVEAGATRLLVDAGLSARSLTRRLEALGVAPRSLAAILLSHELHDHASGAEAFSQRHGVPVVCSAATLAALDRSPGHLAEWIALPEAAALEVGAFLVEAFPLPHDAARPVGFVLRAAGLRVGLATDLGHATTLVVERLRGANALLIESNHDETMLRDGPYPWQLKQRVAGRMGHLSNVEAAELLERVVDDACQAVVLAHLSEHNNTPELARRSAAQALVRAGVKRAAMRVASARRPTPALEIG
jgi:phosphoribosyl 1,2-cyclic phosphodiesterase